MLVSCHWHALESELVFTPNDFVVACVYCIRRGEGAAGIEPLVKRALLSQTQDPAAWEVDELLYRSAELTVVNLVLPSGEKTPAHDHGMWAVIGISHGYELERFYEPSPQGPAVLAQIAQVTIESGQTIRLDPDTIHAIENPRPHTARGVHVYGGDLGAVSRRMWDHVRGLR